MDVGGHHFEDVLILKMADGRGGEGRGDTERRDTLPFPYAIIHHHRTVRYSPVRLRSARRLPAPEAGLPRQLCAAAVTIAAAAVGEFLLAQHVTEGLQGEALQTQALLSAMGLQTLGLTRVPATHFGIAGQEL